MNQHSINSFKDLLVWQKSIVLVKEIYRLTNSFPEEERFGLTSQMRRASISVPSNIAEGWGRMSRRNYIRFLRMSRGSLFELETQLIITKELEYIKECDHIENLIIEVSKMLNSLVKKLEEKA